MPVLYSAEEENCFRRSCANMAKTDFCKCGIAAGSNGKAPLRKSEKPSKLRRSGTPTFKPMVGAGVKKEGADTEKHIETQRKHKKRRKSTEKRRKSTEKAQKKEESIRLVEGRGGERGDKIAVRGGENALNTKGKSCAFQVLL